MVKFEQKNWWIFGEICPNFFGGLFPRKIWAQTKFYLSEVLLQRPPEYRGLRVKNIFFFRKMCEQKHKINNFKMCDRKGYVLLFFFCYCLNSSIKKKKEVNLKWLVHLRQQQIRVKKLYLPYNGEMLINFLYFKSISRCRPSLCFFKIPQWRS